MTIIDQETFETWYDFHTKGDPKFEASENENMEEILNFFTEQTDTPMNHYSVTLRDEYGIVLAIDKHLTNLILLHKVEALPATRQNKKPIVRALYGFGKEAIPVLLDPSILEEMTTADCPSITSIRKAVRDGITDITTLTLSSTYKGMSIIMLPPFIAKALLELPTLAVDKALAATLEAIATYEKGRKPPSSSAAAAKPTAKTPIVETVIDDLDSDGEEEDDDAVLVDPPPKKVVIVEPPSAKKPPASANSTPIVDKAALKTAPTAPSKKKATIPTTYTRCAQLLKFLYIAQHQQHHFEKLEEEILTGHIICPTMELEHRQWAAIQHVHCEVNQPKNDKGKGPSAMTDPTHLFDRVANPLNEIKASIDNLMDKYADVAPSASILNDKEKQFKKLVEKFEPAQLNMFKRLSSTDGQQPRPDLEEFLVKFLTAKGTGTGAAQLLHLNNKLHHRNINIPIGCITAMHQGRFGWDHPTCPNNFSAFYTPRANCMDMGRAAASDLLNVHLRAEVGKGIENGDINKITKQYMTIPGTVTDLVRQLDNHNKLQGDFWGTNSMLYKECNRFIRGIDEYDTSYESAHFADPMFLVKVMYYYDLTLFNLYDECLVKEDFFAIRWELTDLQQCHTKVLQGQFFQSLPPVLQAPASKKRPSSEMDDENPITKPPIKNPKGASRPNPDQHTILQLQTGEDFNDVILRTQQMKLVPNLPGTKSSICVNWHVNGRCHDNCERKSSHKILPDGILKKMEGFLKACRSAHKKVAANKEKK
jgi:hypothetical protein